MNYDGDIMTIPLREPTDTELQSLDIVWLLPSSTTQIASTIRRKRLKTKDTKEVRFSEDVDQQHIQSNDESEINTAKGKALEEDNKKSIDRWKACLAYPTDKVLETTLKSTTQLQQEPVEMEIREYPRQHRKKRLPSLHVTRIPGRVDSDTFFSTVTSKRKYSCVQLFVCTLSKFIFVRCLQRERQSHAAYEDFIREIGAPSLLCTDNAKTQTGEKWTATSRKFQIQQRTTVPHNQNQNHAERSIQEIKHNTMQVLYETNAPLEFWCYCLIFVVDCYNHTANASINNRVPVQVLRGDTPDISAFRYHFWQEIDYFEPRAKFPTSSWKPGWFLNIDWTSGDAFTFLVWTQDHDGSWNKGRELIRNIIRPRKHASSEPQVEDADKDYKKFRFQKKVIARKRKKNDNKPQFKLVDLEELTDLKHDDNLVEADPKLVSKEATDQGGKITNTVDSLPATPNSNETSPINIAAPDNTNAEQSTPEEKSDDESSVGSSNEENDAIEMTEEVNDALSTLVEEQKYIGGSKATQIIGHEWKFGNLYLRVSWDSDQQTLERFIDMKVDHPVMTAQYILNN